MKIPRVYADTSVIGGCFDAQFSAESRALFQMAGEGKIRLLLSDVLAAEIEPAPPEVTGFFAALAPESFQEIYASQESEHLRDAYLKARVIGPSHHRDAHHIALATVARADLLVSWNFRHIVHYDKIRLFNAVNLREGYPYIEIRTPRELV